MVKCIEISNGFISEAPVELNAFTVDAGIAYAAFNEFDDILVVVKNNVMSITHDDGNVVLVRQD